MPDEAELKLNNERTEARREQIQYLFWEKRVDAVKLLSKALKGQVKQIEILREEARIRLEDGRRFYWDTQFINSLGFLMRDGYVEREDSRILSVLIREGFEVFDIGANYGWYTTLFANSVGDSGRVHSFEPVSTTFAELEKNIRLNEQNHVVLNQIALSNYDGEAEMYLPIKSGSEDAALIIDPTLEHTTHKCKVQTLDSYIQDNHIRHIDFVKLDIEGGELNALQGFERYLKQHEKPMMMMEATEALALRFGHSIRDVVHFLKQYNYRMFEATAEALVDLDSLGERKGQNIFCLQPEHIRTYSPFIPFK